MANIKSKKVLVSFRCINAPGVETFSGTIQGLRTSAKWNVQLFTEPHRLTSEDITSAMANGVNGILINHPLQEDLTNDLLASDIPLVVLGNTDQHLFRRRRNIAFIESDNRKIGETAADYLLSLGRFRTYAFLPDIPSSRWSRLRLRGYRTRLWAKGEDVSIFTGDDLGQWLVTLKRPIALFLAGDYLASDAISACKTVGLAVPGDISILGVDNNPILCESAPVPLSSIQPSFSRLGLDAVRILDKLMHSRKTFERPIIHRTPPLRVVERTSTARTKPSANLVERAIRFIAENVDNGISAIHVAKHIGVSPQLLALRFAQLEHTSVRDFIIRTRLEKVKKLLKTSRLPLRSIAVQCGFRTTNHLEHLFARRFGTPPGEWRRGESSASSDHAAKRDKRKR